MLRLFLLLPLFIYSAVSLSGVPEWLEKDTIEKKSVVAFDDDDAEA